MFGEVSIAPDFSIYETRRNKLVESVKEQHPDIKQGLIVIPAAYDTEGTLFQQDGTFYYFTGLEEAGAILTIDLSGVTTIWIPHYSIQRSTWMCSSFEITNVDNQKNAKIDYIKTLGEPVKGYELFPLSSLDAYSSFFTFLNDSVKSGGTIFSFEPERQDQFFEQRRTIDRILRHIPSAHTHLVDISGLISEMRRSKDSYELDLLYKAIDISCMAQEEVAGAIQPGMLEAELQAHVSYIFIAAGARNAFQPIIGSGKNSTIIHYQGSDRELVAGDLVLVDIGANYNYYCGDITRTYPVSGKFTDRQRELYNLVLETQEYIASIAKPGYWLCNKDRPKQSLNHCAHNYLKERGGYDRYFSHGIGHLLGINTHDVGDVTKPLQVGDVFTIEPGIYIPDEAIGIRIEDDYWMSKSGAICLSDQLPKKIAEVEHMMRGNGE